MPPLVLILAEAVRPLPPKLKVISTENIANLWSNYGHIYRIRISDDPESLILKSIHPPTVKDPSESHLRKLLSYDVERFFYHSLASRLPSSAKLAKSYHVSEDAEHNLLLEDLSVHFPFPVTGSLNRDATNCVLNWLAEFHAIYFGVHNGRSELPLIPPPMECEGLVSRGVWRRGTYWYLNTRRGELEDMDKEECSWLIPWIERVNNAIAREITKYGTLVHGDVKGANIVFSRNPDIRGRGARATKADTPLQCALYDLQYVGLGLCTLDLVYFLGTSVTSHIVNPDNEKVVLETYHRALVELLPLKPDGSRHTYDFDNFWQHWELAIVDWYRFMAGWGFWGNSAWVERRAREIVRGWEVADPVQLYL